MSSGFCSSGSAPGFQTSQRVFSETSTGPVVSRTLMRTRPLVLSSASLSRTLALTSFTAPASGRFTGDMSVARSAAGGTLETPSLGVSAVELPDGAFFPQAASVARSTEMQSVVQIEWRMKASWFPKDKAYLDLRPGGRWRSSEHGHLGDNRRGQRTAHCEHGSINYGHHDCFFLSLRTRSISTLSASSSSSVHDVSATRAVIIRPSEPPKKVCKY